MLCMGSKKFKIKKFVNSSTISVAYFLANSSPFIILADVSTPVGILHESPWKGLL